nr:cytochrome P450 6B1-like isoform X2 [Maniola hyperantus]
MTIYLVLSFVICVYYLSYFLFFKNYWKNRNVPFVKPLPFFGNYKDSLLLKKHRSEVMKEICQQFPNEPYIGSFYGTTPALVIQDPNLLKLVMSKEFYYFNGRETSDHNHKEMFTKNLVLAHGDEWKVLRMNLTPLFSSMKLKNMFYLIKNCSDMLESLLAEEIEANPNIEIGNLFSKYTMDCVTACVFGLCSETMKKDDHKNPFSTIEPELFRPERFFGEAKKNIKPYTYMPFGEGPRICLGMRFAKMPIYAALLKVFMNYRVELADNMQHKISYNPKSIFVSQPIGGIYVKFITRKA